MLSLYLLFLPLSAWSLPLLGWVESPGYPRGYPEDTTLNWMRCAPPGNALSLTLTHLDLEDSEDCTNDALQISVDNRTVYNLCGRMSYEELQSSVNPSLLSSVSGCLSLSFNSDYSNSERHNGFRAFYTVQDVDECAHEDNGCNHFCSNYIGGYRCFCRHGYRLQTDTRTCTAMCTEDLSGSLQGMVSSPGWPGSYAADAQCSYTLSVEDGVQLVLEFNGEFDVEEEDGVCKDSLLIKTPNQDFGPFCGKDPPASPILTGSHQVQIVFNSDSSGSNAGFRLIYTSREKTCPNQVTPNSQVTPKLPRYQKSQKVTVQCNTGFFHNQDVAEVPHIIDNVTYTSWCGRTGTWSPVYSCEVVECGEPDIQENQWPLDILNMTKTQYQGAIHLQCKSKYYNLEGEERYICDHHGEWRSEAGQTDFPKCVPVCGRTEKELISFGRIIGGTQAEHEQIPWQLRIVQHRAGAALINDKWAITAAHVFNQLKENPRILGGGIDLKQRKTMINLNVEKYYIHPKYLPQEENYDNDIALIKLKTRAPLSSSLLPVCLPAKTDAAAMEGQWGTISGWGATKNNDMAGRSMDLLYANVEIYSSGKCSQTPLHKDKQVPLVFTDNMFCAGDRGKDSCKGDSGGPLVVPPLGPAVSKDKKPYQLYGIVSWGEECGDLGYYTKVDKYLDWIKETMEKESSSAQ
ncbi:complement C1s subcomponent [Paramormyrops kingsleyae]|nr:complement C1s subcomponent-like [Paramormyrops kingsleyae]